jgi:hypothetical protein
MASADDFSVPPARVPKALLERRAAIHDRIAAIGTGDAPIDALRTVARDTASPGVVRAAAILAIADRDESLDLETSGEPAVAAALTTVRLQARARDAIAATARGERVQLPSAAMLAPPVRGKPLERRGVEAAQASRAIEAVRPELRATTPVVSSALRCGENDIAVVTSLERLDIDTLLSEPAHPGSVVVHHTVELDTWTAPFEVLTQPDGGGVAISVIDRRGEVRYAGHGESLDGGLEIRLHAADRPGATPVEVVARIDADGVQLEGVTATGGANRLSPAPDHELRR